MFLSRFRSIQRAWEHVALRLSWNHLPPLTTHVLVFLLGTLLLRTSPEGGRGIPQQLLYPADKLLSKSAEGLRAGSSYLLAGQRGEGKALCRHWDQPLRLWMTPSSRAQKFLVLPLRKNTDALLRLLLLEEALVLVANDKNLPPCTTSVSYD